MSRCGEHLIYLNATDGAGGTLCDSAVFEGVILDTPALEDTHTEGHYVQMRNCGKITFTNCEGFGAGTFATYPTFAFNLTEVAEVIVNNCNFKDLTNYAFNHVQNSGSLLVTDSKFSTFNDSTQSLLRADSSNGIVRFFNCSFKNIMVSSSVADQTPLLYFNGCDWKNSSEWSISGQDVILIDCKIEAAGTQRYIYVREDIKLTLKNCEITGTNPAIGIVTEGLVDIDNLRMPVITGGNCLLFLSANTGASLVKNCFLPLANTASSVKLGGTVGDFVIGGLYMPLGSIYNSGSGTLTQYGNVVAP